MDQPVYLRALGLLRPAKFRAAVGRRWFEHRVRRIPLDAYPGRLDKLGSSYGGWNVPAADIDEEWTCYCVGAGADVTFDLELLRLGARVRTVDPFSVFGEMAVKAARGHPRFSFHEVAIAATDGPVRMYGRQDGESGALSAENLYRTDESFEKAGRTVASLASEAGDQRVDLLKLDVEGSEYEILDNLDPETLGIQVICVELHHTVSSRRAQRTVARLRERGFRLVHREDPSDFTFIKSDLPVE